MPPKISTITLLCLLSVLGIGPRDTLAAENWVELRSPHFIVYTPASEKDARNIANQFEQIRALFHAAFPRLHTNPAQPVVILAVKGEKGMKELLPEQWEVKGHVHVAGLYQPGLDKHYVILQLDAEGNNPYHTLYHEYTHSLLHLNFAHLPLWLDEGLAEYLGNATIGEKESRIGVIDPTHLYILQQNRLMPIETLLAVEHDSPYYNEANRASVFYAESWALVHYLLLDPDARQKQRMAHFLDAWNQSHDQIEAARQSFGDLKKFGQVIDGYVRREAFYNGVVQNSQEAADRQLTARPVSPAEVMALRGDFFVHHNRPEAGKPLLEEAAKQDTSLPLPHVALAGLYYRQQNPQGMQNEAAEAVRLGDSGFFTSYLMAMSRLHLGISSEEAQKSVIALLEKSIASNSLFAPSYDLLSEVYALSPDTQTLAINSSVQAVRADSSDLEYAVRLTELLLNNNRDGEAKIVSDRILKAAATPEEREMARELTTRVAQHRPLVGGGAAGDAETGASKGAANVSTVSGAIVGTASHESDRPPEARRVLLGVDGTLGDVDCSRSPEINLNLQSGAGLLAYHVADIHKIAIGTVGNEPAPECSKWSGRRVKLWFTTDAGSKPAAEVAKLTFQ
jgi:hypothetical protein